jgi:hypothetical protein
MRLAFSLLVIVLLGACSGGSEDEIIAAPEFAEESNILVDSCASSIAINEINRHNLNGNIAITNINYSIERFIYENEMREFICKSTVEEENSDQLNRVVRYEKKEFYEQALQDEACHQWPQYSPSGYPKSEIEIVCLS